MHCEAGPPHWKLIQTKKSQKARERPDRQTDRWMDEHIILLIRGFEPVDCSHMRCTRLRAMYFDY